MARSIWAGAINFGMVSIPTKVYSATNDAKVDLHQYHKKDSGRVKQPKVCAECGETLESGDIVKGYDTGESVVLLTEEDFASLPLKSIKSIQVVEFIDPSQVDIRCFDSAYFISAEKTGLKAYKLLTMVMEKTGVAGVCKWTYRERERLAIIRAFNGVMLLQTMLYDDQLRPYDEFKPGEITQMEIGGSAGITEKEITMGMALIGSMRNENFNHSIYSDEYRSALERVIEVKLTGGFLESPEEPAVSPEELADQLLASLEAAGVELPA
jgi:DNA end-binding protein Ku